MRLGISYSRMGDIEAGRSEFRSSELAAFAALVDQDIDFLLSASSDPEGGTDGARTLSGPRRHVKSGNAS